MSAAYVQKVANLLKGAASTATPGSKDDRPWDHGWSLSEYRESERATLSSPDGPVKLSNDGKRQFAEAVGILMAREEVRVRWDKEEVWTIVGSLIVHTASSNLSDEAIQRHVLRFSSVSPALNVFPLANIRWDGPPIAVAGAVVGRAGAEVQDMICTVSQITDETFLEQLREYVAKEAGMNRNAAIFACRTDGQSRKAHAEASRRFQSIADLALLLVDDREELGMYSLRGKANRPGVRGSTIDRSVVEHSLKSMRRELVAEPLVISTFNAGRHVYWTSADPFPLEVLLRAEPVYAAVRDTLTITGPVATRLSVSSRWFAEAFWAEANDDAALALGVALDALLGSKSGLPGRAMAERFALLDPVPERRQDRAKRYLEIYGVRSSVAHGGQSRQLDDYKYIRAVENDVSWTARRLLALHSSFNPASQSEFDAVFEGLRWGTEKWPVPTNVD
jgi:hypothetical protein